LHRLGQFGGPLCQDTDSKVMKVSPPNMRKKLGTSQIAISLVIPLMSSSFKCPCLDLFKYGSTNYGVPDCLSRRGGSGVDEWWGRLRRPGSSWTFPCEHPVFGGPYHDFNLVSPAFIRYNKSTAQHVPCAIEYSSRQQNVRRSLLVFRKHKTGFLASISRLSFFRYKEVL
jgi:hypothetical protein